MTLKGFSNTWQLAFDNNNSSFSQGFGTWDSKAYFNRKKRMISSSILNDGNNAASMK